jgi:hypothetical protein
VEVGLVVAVGANARLLLALAFEFRFEFRLELRFEFRLALVFVFRFEFKLLVVLVFPRSDESVPTSLPVTGILVFGEQAAITNTRTVAILITTNGFLLNRRLFMFLSPFKISFI